MLILALDSAVGRCSATVVAADTVVVGFQQDLERGHASVLPVMARDCLRDAGLQAAELDMIAVTVGPGSFTGIRAGVALAQGISVAAGCPAIAVTVGEALAISLPQLGARTLWCATKSRRGRIFLETCDEILSLAVTDLPDPRGSCRHRRSGRARCRQPARCSRGKRHADGRPPAHRPTYRSGRGAAFPGHDPTAAGGTNLCRSARGEAAGAPQVPTRPPSLEANAASRYTGRHRSHGGYSRCSLRFGGRLECRSYSTCNWRCQMSSGCCTRRVD